MFSYRHAYHAGNHADILKHIALIAAIKHLTAKETALHLIDTHAGLGVYHMDSTETRSSQEAEEGLFTLLESIQALGAERSNLSEALQDYLRVVDAFDGAYPGSPYIMQHFMRTQDTLSCFELMPADYRSLQRNMQTLSKTAQIHTLMENSFDHLKRLLPPTSRRGLILIDPSYELKSDYQQVAQLIEDGLKRFATGCYMIWYPIVAKPEAHTLPKRLKTLANQSGKSWLQASLSLDPAMHRAPITAEPVARQKHPKLTASGLFVINPPHTLKSALTLTLPQVARLLGNRSKLATTLSSHGI